MMGRTSKYKFLLILAGREDTLLRINLCPACPTSKIVSVQFTSFILACRKDRKNFFSTESTIWKEHSKFFWIRKSVSKKSEIKDADSNFDCTVDVNDTLTQGWSLSQQWPGIHLHSGLNLTVPRKSQAYHRLHRNSWSNQPCYRKEAVAGPLPARSSDTFNGKVINPI